MTIKEIVAVGMAAVCVGLAAAVLYRPAQLASTDYTVLACTSADGGMVPLGISTSIKIRPQYYWVKDGEGNWQTYRPGAFESCITLSLDDAKKKGLVH